MTREELTVSIVGYTILIAIVVVSMHYGVLDDIDLDTLMMMAGSMQ